jgi:hypothetical protein
MSAPIDPAAISDDIRDVLAQIGFTDPVQLADQLQTTENSMAKTFVNILMNPLNIEGFPWEFANVGVAHPNIESFHMQTLPVGQLDQDDHRGALVERPRGPWEDSHSVMYSFARQSDMAIGEVAATVTIMEVELECVDMPVWSVMTHVQVWLGVAGFLWFHPTSVSIWARSPDASLYFSVNARFVSPVGLSLGAKLHKGDENAFREVLDHMQKNI